MNYKIQRLKSAIAGKDDCNNFTILVHNNCGQVINYIYGKRIIWLWCKLLIGSPWQRIITIKNNNKMGFYDL